MLAAPPRRPRFLAALPAEPRAEPPRFGRAERGSRPALPPLAPAAVDAPPAPTAEQAAEARREALARVAQAVEMLRTQASWLAEQARADALEIGFQVARRVLESELRTSPEPLFALVKSALRRTGDSRRVSIRLSPADAAELQSPAGQAAVEGIGAARIEIQADATLQPGDCVVDTDFGQIDGRLETRLGELRRALEGAAEGAAG
ncbi:MAG: flagellar assembly protein FliH [Deltaproteobacteria bacterium]|nr:flagellar assembly protein FliH [Deltaproteobacteria bacterium]